MTSLVLHGTKLQYNDYWFMVDRTFHASGWIDLEGLFTFQNEHPAVLPQVVYWANYHLSAGSNIVLGIFVVLVGFTQILLIGRFVERDRWATPGTWGLMGAAGLLLFSRQGAHNFVLAMSGTSWLLANVLVLAAVLARWRHRFWTAILLGLLASLTYGTGLVVWPALLAVGMVTDRRWRPDLPVLGFGAITAVWYFAVRNPPTEESVAPTATDLMRATPRILGSVLRGPLDQTEVLGWIGLVLGVVLLVIGIRERRWSVAPWAGLFVYATGAALLIAQSRFGAIAFFGHQSRYTSISALFWIAVLGLLVTVVDLRWLALVPALVLGVTAALHGGREVRFERDLLPQQEELAAALRLDLADGADYFFVPYPRVAPLLDALDHYPFDGTYTGDCAMAGQTLPASGPSDAAVGRLQHGWLLTNGRGARMFGRIPAEVADEAACVLIVDEDRRVVGFGPPGGGTALQPELDADRSFAAVAPLGSASYRAYVVLDNGALLRLAGTLTRDEIDRGEAPVTAAGVEGLVGAAPP